jgi:predicted DCC family thiol-disulfide oxidoreductase YuxK
MHEGEATALLAGVPEDERYTTWHLAPPRGAPVGHGAGARELLCELRLTRPLGRALRIVPDRALDHLYHLVAANRSRLGRLVPDAAGPRRYP